MIPSMLAAEDRPLLRLPLQVLLDRFQRLFQLRIGDIVNEDLVCVLGENMGDAAPHLPCPENTDYLEHVILLPVIHSVSRLITDVNVRRSMLSRR